MTESKTVWTPLAIVGASCRLPGARNIDEFWELVRTGGDASSELPNDVLDRELYYDPLPGKRGKSYSLVGGLIPRLPFDNSKCRLPDEAIANYDVSHLTMCEVTSEALSDANYDPFNLPQRNAGVYFGHTGGSSIAGDLMYAIGVEETAQYLHEVEGLRELPKVQRDEVIEQIVSDVRRAYDFRTDKRQTNLAPVAGCELIAKAFGLTGPCLVVDAACASSLQALAIGARALVHGSIDMAIVGGASCCKGDSLVLFSAAQSVTADKSRPFDEAASGLVTAEGYVTLVLKRLEDAVAAGDRIRGVIRGVGMSSDGKGKSLWAPLKDGQKLAIHRAYDNQVRPPDIQFMEAHATSTQVGDATELAALAEAFPSVADAARKIPLGSVKANIGHTLETAGVAGLLKTLLAMEHGIIPPCANVETPNSDIAWDELPFYLPRAAAAWDRNGTLTRKAAVNAFGIGGLNVHIVLEEYSAQLPTSHYGAAAKTKDPVARREPVAIIGMGAILPGVRSIEDFWQLLKSGSDPKTEVTPERWNAEIAYDSSAPRKYRSYSKRGGFCTDYRYDWRKHRVPPKQVAAANPLQFMLLDAADQALAQGGYLGKEFDHERVGVIVGTNFGGDFSDDLQMGLKLPDFKKRLSKLLSERGGQKERIEKICADYEAILLARKPALIDETGSFTSSTLASRITKTFNLKGGALAMDAGVGTGLAALSAAVDALRSRDCDMMICAAGQRNMDLQAFEEGSRAGLLTKGTPAPAFDQESSGYLPGEGCAVLLLKRLSDAKRDNDTVLGTIHDVAGAADWKTPGKAFELATQRALAGAQLAGDAIRSVEAIGTLPALEDAEVRSVARLLATPGRQYELSFNSIVPQFGFMGATHSLAATIKACLAIGHGESPVATPPTKPRENLFPAGAAAQQAIVDLSNPDCSAISILGGAVRGTCYQAIVGREPKAAELGSARAEASPNSTRAKVVRFGASTWEQLRQSLQSCSPAKAWDSENAFTEGDAVRLAIVGESEADLASLQQELGRAGFPWTAEQRRDWAARGVFCGEPKPGSAHCAFIFPGHSSQYPGMFAQAIAELPAAALAQRQADASLESLGFETFEDVAGKQAIGLGSNLWNTQAGILVGSWVSYRTITSFGLRPSIALGHSFGEYMALLAAGAWGLTDVIRAAKLRTEAIESVPELDGVMAATGADRETINQVLDKIDGVFVANYNSPRQTVISGHRQAVLEAIAQLKVHRASAVLIKVPAPFHSPLLKPASEFLARRLMGLPIRRAEIPVVSTAGLGEMRDAEKIIESLSKQLVTPVDFPAMLDQLLKTRPALVVEVGPKQILTRLCETNHPESDVLFMASDNPKRHGSLSFLDVVAQADCLGCLDAETPEKRPPVESRLSKRAPRFLVFDATERRRERMRLQSARVSGPRTSQPKGGAGAEGNGNGNGSGRHHNERTPADVVSAVAAAGAASRRAPAKTATAVAAPTPRPHLERPHLERPVLEKSTQQSAQPQVDVSELRQILIDFVVEQTGYPDEMIEMDADLEADLGIDSIKKAQLFGEVGARFSLVPRDDLSLDDFPTLQHVADFLVQELGVPEAATRHAEEVAAADEYPKQPLAPPPAPMTAPESSDVNVDTNELREILIDFVVEQTGYPDDMIEMDADLEADLGIDSIKKAQLFGEVGARFSLVPRDDLSLDDFPTLQHVADFLVQELSTPGAPVRDPEEVVSVVENAPAPLAPPPVEAPPVEAPPVGAPPVEAPARATSEASIDVEDLRQILVDFVVEQTGYPEDMIELDADLEADLGIDSIKKAQLFGEVGSRFAIVPRDDLSLDEFPTLQHVIDFLVTELGAGRRQADGTAEAMPSPSVSEPAISIRPGYVAPPSTCPEFARVMELVGDGAVCGKQHGEKFRREIQQNLMRLASEAPGVQSAGSGWSGEFQTELAGIAAAALVNDESIFAWNAVDRSSSLRVGFSETAAPCEVPDGIAAAVQTRQARNGLKYITIGHAGQLTVPFGLNSARLAVSSSPTGRNPSALDIVTVAQKLHELLAGCSSVDEAQQMLLTLRPHSTWVIGISDLSSTAAKLMLISGAEPVDAGEGSAAQQEFHKACAAAPHDLRIYDRQSRAVQTVSLDQLLPRPVAKPTSLVLPSEKQTFQRHVLRMVPAAVTPARTAAIPTGETVTIVGEGAVAREVQARLSSHGCRVELVSDSAWQSGFRDHLDRQRPRHVIMIAPTNTALSSFQPSDKFARLLASCQHWIVQLEQSGALEGATLSAVTQMGGDFGFGSRGLGFAGGALTGLFKGIRREYPALRLKVVDVSATEAPAAAADSLLNELRSECTQLEVGYRNNERFVVSAVASPCEQTDTSPSAGDVWIVTGGGRGVTAAVAKEIGREYGLSLHLLGTAPPPDPRAQWQGLDEQGLKDLRRKLALQAREQGKKPDQLWRPIEKSMELELNLQSFEQAGARAEYHQCDITDRASLSAVLESIRTGDGPIRGIVHGAGVEAACRFSRKQPEMVRATIASKCDGAANLISLTLEDSLKYFVGFGSTSGRFGGLGQADYSLASDLLAKMLGRLAEERPDCKAVCFHWPAWDEVGMAARPESRMALERGGLSFMSPKEGVSHFAAELSAAGSDHEILILNDPGMLDTDGTMSRREAPVAPATFRRTVAASAPVAPAAATAPTPVSPLAPVVRDALRLVRDLRPGSTTDETYADFFLEPASDLFLIHHTLRGNPFLPGVMTMQAFAEAAQLLRPNEHFIGLSNVSLDRGLSVESGQALKATIRLKNSTNGVLCELLVPFTNSRGEAVESARVYATARVDFGSPVTIPPPPSRDPLFGWHQFQYPPTGPVIHGPPLQTFKSLAFQHGTGLALIESRDPRQLLGTRSLQGVALPSAELDGCLVVCGFFVFAMVEQTINLPYAIKEYRFCRQPEPLEECKLSFDYHGRSEVGHRFDFTLAAKSGETLLQVKDYETIAIRE